MDYGNRKACVWHHISYFLKWFLTSHCTHLLIRCSKRHQKGIWTAGLLHSSLKLTHWTLNLMFSLYWNLTVIPQSLTIVLCVIYREVVTPVDIWEEVESHSARTGNIKLGEDAWSSRITSSQPSARAAWSVCLNPMRSMHIHKESTP